MREIILATMGEIALKGMNRRSFENALLKALRHRTKGLGQWKLRAMQSAIYIEPADAAAEANVAELFARCQRVFGIATVGRAAVCEKDFEAIAATAAEYLHQDLSTAGTFKVKARRADKSFPMDSMEIGRELGGRLLDQFPQLAVDVHTPAFTVVVEIREQGAYIHGGRTRGAGGLPIPTSGRAALLLSGGIDSPVAGWLMGKRGLATVGVHFASPPYTSPRAAAKVEELARLMSRWCGPIPYYHVPYTKTQEYLRDTLPRQDHFTVMMRRSMLRITAIIAQKEQCEALVTGESLAQVASQTMAALVCTDAAQDLPVLRPCIGMDKSEITDIARRIGTFETSILPYEDCCTIFNPPHPKTKPRLVDVERFEAAMPQLAALEAQAAENAEFKLIEDGA